jgi:hypothetical protein
LRKENSGFVMSVCLSALEETSHRTNFHEIWYLRIFENLSIKLKSHSNMTIITRILHAYVNRFMMKSRPTLLKKRNVSDKSCRENNNTQFIFNNFFSENRAVYEICGEIRYSRTGYRLKYYTAQKLYKNTDTHSYNFNTYCFSTATMVTLTHLNAASYVHRLSFHCTYIYVVHSISVFCTMSIIAVARILQLTLKWSG